VPRTTSYSPRKISSVTPWSTYVHASATLPPRKEEFKETPKRKPKKESVSPSPVAHSKEPAPLSPFVFSPVKEEERNAPFITEYPHESVQLPRRNNVAITKPVKPAVEVFEEFIAKLPLEDKERVRATYNGPDWPGRRLARMRPESKPPTAEPSVYKSFTISNQSYIFPPQGSFTTTIHHNRFLVGLPSFSAPQIPVFQYFRGC